MADYRDTFTSEIYVNQSQAQDAIEKYTKRLEDLNKQLASIDKSQDGWEKKEKKLQRQIQSTERTLKGVQTGVQNYQKAMNSLDGRSIANLIKLKKQLNAEIKKLVPGTQEYIRMTQDLKKVEARIKSLTTATQSMSTRITGFFTKYWTMFDTLSKSITGLSMKFRQSAEDAARLDDVYADVMKTTGLLHDEVQELDKALMKIDTRTSREQLLLLARDAGKLGIQGKENILGFVRAADQIQVALGEDLGEGAIKNLGKIADVLGLTKEMGIEKSLLSIASAVNALGQASTASEAYLVDFTQRLAGVGAMAGLSVQDILGFASGLDQSSMKVEMAATAFQKFLMKMYEDTATFAGYANMEVEEFSNMLKTNANEAIIAVMKAMNGQDGFAAMVPIFDQMGLDGARAVTVLSSMTKNLDAVTEAQALANVEFEKATSVTEEYRTKNNNLQAQLEKARKEFKNASIALGQSLNPVLLKSTKGVTYLIKALANYGKEIKGAVIAVGLFTAAVKAHAIAHAAVNAVTKVGMTLKATYKTIVLALRVAYLKLTGQMEAAAVAQAELTAAMSTNVFGLIATAIAGLVAALVHFTKEAKKSNEVTAKMEEIQKRINSEFAQEAGKVQALNNIVHNNTIEIEQRRRALEELKKIVPEYHADLTREGQLIRDNTDALDDYIKNLERATRAKVLEDEYMEAVSATLEAEKNLETAKQNTLDALVAAHGNKATISGLTMQSSAGAYSDTRITPYGQALKDEEEAQKALNTAKEIQAKVEERIGKEQGKRAAATKKEYSDLEKDIIAIEEKYKRLEEEIKNAYVGAPAEGVKALGKLQEEMDKEIAAARKKYAKVDASGNGDGGGKKVKGDAAKKAFDEEIKLLEQSLRSQENALKESLMNREISQAEYNAKMNLLTMQGLQKRIELAKKYGQDETKYVSKLLDEEIKLVGDGMEEIQEKISEYTPKSDIVDPKANEEFWNKIMAQRDEIVAKIQDKSLKKEYDTEMQWINKLHEQELLSEEQFQRAKLQTKLKYLQEYTQQFNAIQEEASNFITALKEAESAKLEAQYQKDLTAAGDNAEKREQIEADYEKKKLELQKKYADTEMVINIAKTIAAGALAAIQAFAQLGPIGGAVAAALIAVTTAAEVATIVQQRNAIKNSSVNSSASSASSNNVNTGQRTITGHADGGYTEDHTTLATVGEEGVEWIAPHWMVRDNPTTFANLERYRKSGIRGRKSLSDRGFADGGFSDGSIPGSAVTKEDIEAAVESVIIRTLGNNYIRAYVVRRDITELDDQDNRFKKQTSRG